MPPHATLAALPVSSLAFALGMCVARPQRPENAGRISALAAELRRRGAYDEMVATLDPSLQRALSMMVDVDRGQAWNQGRRDAGRR